MSSLEENYNKLFRNSISYLHNISALDYNPPALKCIYLTKARLMELRQHVVLPPTTTKSTVRCQRCLLNLNDGPATYKIKPEEKKTKFARKVLAKSRKNKPMTKYQRQYYKKLNTFNGNQLEITCKFCKKETCIKTDKPRGIIHPKVITAAPVKKRKSRKKDKFCGLMHEAVLSATPQIDKLPDFIPLEASDKKLRRFQPSKKENVTKTVPKKVITRETVRQSKKNQSKKTKLKEFLSASNTNRSNSSSNLQHFLQSL